MKKQKNLNEKGQLGKGTQAFWFLILGDVTDSALNSVLGNITYFSQVCVSMAPRKADKLKNLG